ncbi:MAG: rod shape-determining protein MreC [Clostridia bacterium]|nr:rod shape-determining protein MreC [Clostridia bacterium]
MTRYKFFGNLVLIVIVLILLLTGARFTGMERDSFTILETGIQAVKAPLASGATGVIQKVKDFFGMLKEIDDLREENALLKKRIGELTQEIDLLRDYGLENIRLRELLDFKEAHINDFELLTAKVIGRDPSNWYSTIILNKGTNDGVQKDMTVITHQGLVGRVINTSPRASEVLLIIDQEGAVGARVWETRETLGVVEGRGQDNNLLTMIHMAHDAEIAVGQTIVTSGLAGIFPPGIKIGEVVAVKDETSGLMKQAEIKTFVDFNRLEEVFIILEVSDLYQIQQELENQKEGLEQ